MRYDNEYCMCVLESYPWETWGVTCQYLLSWAAWLKNGKGFSSYDGVTASERILLVCSGASVTKLSQKNCH